MKAKSLLLRSSYFSLALGVGYLILASGAACQQHQAPTGNTSPSAKFPAAKAQAPDSASRDANPELDTNSQSKQEPGEKDSPEAIRKREEWFYKQRASVHGHIPAGVRLKAFQHMQHMMAAEGKLVLRPDGGYTSATPQSGSTTFPAWTSVGPTPTTGGTFSPVTGRITTIAVDPSDPTGNTVLIGGAQGGIWRSTDAGVTWAAVSDQNASLAMGSIAFAPSSSATVYAGTGEQASIGFDIYYGAGVLKSTDRGQTWVQTCTVAGPTCPFIGPYLDGLTPGFGFFNFGGAHISYVAVNPANPNLILAGAQFIVEGPQEGVYCSSNGGASWTNILPDEMATFVGFASSNVAFVALGNPFGSSPGAPHGNGIYKSTNASSCSATFTPLAGGLPAQSTMGRMDLGISPNFAADNTVYASIASASDASTTNLGVWVTTNGGTSWTQTAAPDVCQFQCWYDDVLKVDPSNKNTVFFGGSSVLDANGNPQWVVRSTTGGSSWSTVLPNQLGVGLPHVDTHALAFFKLPGGKVRMYLGNDGGIWRTDDAEALTIAWTNLNDSLLTLTQFYPSISINTSSPSIAFAGTQDNGSQNYQGGVSWVDNHQCGDGGSTAVDAVVPSTVYIGCATGYPVNASYQNGTVGTFSPAVNGIDPTDPSDFIPPLATDPNTANLLYFGTTRIYQSFDAANTWTALTGPLVSAPGDWLTAIAVEPGNSNVVYTGSSGGEVFAAQTATTQSAFFQVGSFPIAPRAVTGIAIDPSDPMGNTAYVALSGFSFNGTDPLGYTVTDLKGHIFKTVNANSAPNATFQDVSCSTADCSKPAASDLPNIPVNDIVLDPDVPGTMYAATDLGVYVGNCTVTPCTWSTLGTGLPRVAVLSLRLHEASRTLFAATHGRGVWTIALNNFAFTGPRIFSLTPTSASAGGAQLALTVTGTALTGGTIMFGSTALTSTGTSSDTSISGTVPSTLLVAGIPKVSVQVGANTSNALPFSVLALTPTLTSISPASTPVQNPNPTTNIQVQLTGTNFASSAKVLFNGAPSGITTTFNSSSSLSATLPASLLGPFGSTNDIEVLNTPPGGGKSTPVTFKVVAPPPVNDNLANAINITSLTYVDVKDSSGATTQSGDPTPPFSCVSQFSSAQGNTGGSPNGAYNTIWYQYTPYFSANLEVDTIGSSYDTVLSIWTGSPGSLTSVACNDDINPGIVVQSQLTGVPLTAGTTYYIMVSSFGPPDPNPIALGGKSVLNFAYNGGLNLTPTITSLSPNTLPSGSPAFTLTVTGTNYMNGAYITFNGAANAVQEQTTFVSSTQLTANISASEVSFPGNEYQVFVTNPPPSATSAPASFLVTVGTYPVPVLNEIIPTSAVAGGVGFTLSALGNYFAPNAFVQFNGTEVSTVNNNSQVLTATIPASAIASAGTVQVAVVNPPPGGGTSSPQPFTLTLPTTVPTISSVSPASAASGSNGTFTITGTGFQQGSSVYFNGSFGPTTFVSSTQVSTFLNLNLVAAGTYPLYVVDSPPAGTSAPFNFIVTGPPDFSFTVAAGQSSQTVNAGQTATYMNVISVNAVNGFTGSVTAACLLPAQAVTCSVMPSTLTAGQSANVVVTTTARGLMPPLAINRRILSWPRIVPLLVLMLLCFLLARLARTRRQRAIVAVPLAGVILFLVLQATGCGGGSSQPPPPPPPTGTLAGIYTITVTGTAASSNTTHMATLQLTVN
ncbi:MAG: IPT/TIG domain-containing protein [Candidatus Acidiferrum sp.]